MCTYTLHISWAGSMFFCSMFSHVWRYRNSNTLNTWLKIISADSCSSPRLLVKQLLKCCLLSAMAKTNYRLFSWSKKMYTTWIIFYAVYIYPEWKIRISMHAIKAMKHSQFQKKCFAYSKTNFCCVSFLLRNCRFVCLQQVKRINHPASSPKGLYGNSDSEEVNKPLVLSRGISFYIHISHHC